MSLEHLFVKSDQLIDKTITVDGEETPVKVKQVGYYHCRAFYDDMASADRETRINAGNKALALAIYTVDGEKVFAKADDCKKLKVPAHKELIRVFSEVNADSDEEAKNA